MLAYSSLGAAWGFLGGFVTSSLFGGWFFFS